MRDGGGEGQAGVKIASYQYAIELMRETASVTFPLPSEKRTDTTAQARFQETQLIRKTSSDFQSFTEHLDGELIHLAAHRAKYERLV